MNRIAAWSVLLLLGTVNLLVPIGLLMQKMDRPGFAPGEFAKMMFFLIPWHLAATAAFFGCAAISPRSHRWVWFVDAVLLSTMIPLLALYIYVARYGTGLSGIVFVWGPLAQMMIGGCAVIGGVFVQRFWQPGNRVNGLEQGPAIDR